MAPKGGVFILCSFLAQFAVTIEYPQKLHARPAREIFNAYCHILIFAFHWRVAGAYVRYSKATTDTAAAACCFIPTEIVRVVYKAQDAFKAQQWIRSSWGGAPRRALIESCGCHRTVAALFSG